MPYNEMLYYTVNSKCILEVNQGGAVGYTSRFLEAVMYNKKLLTNNCSIQKSAFFSPEYIQCFSKVEEINLAFISEDLLQVDYGYQGEFSPLHLIEKIENEL